MPFGPFLSALSSLEITLLSGFGVLQILLCASIFFMISKQRQQEQKLSLFFGDKQAHDLEKILIEQLKEIKVLDQEIQELFEVLNKLRDLSIKTIHKVRVDRFNPFKEVGGNQSFCVALLDGNNSGAIISSLHTREGTRVYAKPVFEGQAKEFPFTDEEKETVIKAIHGQKAKAV